MTVWKRILWVLIIAIVAFGSYSGFRDGIPDFMHGQDQSLGAKIVASLSIFYAVAGILFLICLQWKRAGAFYVALLWAIAVDACGVLAVIVYSPEAAWIGPVSAGVGVAAVLIPLLIFVRNNSR